MDFKERKILNLCENFVNFVNAKMRRIPKPAKRRSWRWPFASFHYLFFEICHRSENCEIRFSGGKKDIGVWERLRATLELYTM